MTTPLQGAPREMAVKIRVGPPQIAIHQGHSVLLTQTDGQIASPSDKGLFFRDTRLVSSWRAYVNGVSWELLNGAATSAFGARVFMTNRPITTANGPVAAHTLGFCLTRHIHGGIHEDLDLTNQNSTAVHVELEIAIRSDFADLFEVKSGQLVRRGQVSTQWSDDAQRLSTTYRNAGFERAISIACSKGSSPAVYANGRITFSVDLPAHGAWHTCLHYDLSDGDQLCAAPDECYGTGKPTLNEVELGKWQASVPTLESSNNGFEQLFRQAIDDLAALRFPVRVSGENHTVPAAGLPWFVALFGRDTLISSLQTSFVHAEFATAALAALSAWQATERDDYRDAEPGKILHELRRGELASLKLIPHTPYYGSADATPLYLTALHTAWMSTGDRDLLARYLPTAERCLDWIEQCGDRDGDGFQEYETRSSAGLENQSWKDSGDALVYPDGSLVKGPKALCELQGYVYDAWLRMAQIYDHLGHDGK
ncbi:MAG: amylo-alpha-1,6-glucosidase, partial [Janthinobacterium lividum]